MATATRSAADGTVRNSRGLVGYFFGAYLLTWLFWIPAVLADAGQLTLPLPSFAFLAIGGLGPVLAAIVVTANLSGTPGVRRLFGQLKRWRVPPRWYGMALGGIPLIGLAAAGIHATLGGTLATETISNILVALPFQFVFVALIGGGLDEEMGWRGFALPRLQARYDAVVANLVLGVLWTCWHLPLFFVGSDVFARSPFALYLLETIAISFVLGWIYNSTGGSLLLAVLAHTAQNVTTSAVENLVFDPFLGALSSLQYELIESGVWVLAAVAVVLLTRGTLNADRVPTKRSGQPAGR